MSEPASDPALQSGVAPPAAEAPPTFWGAVKEAVAGRHRHDYTEGPIGRALLLLAVPMVLEVALESVFAVVNIFWVGRLHRSAVAAVGMTEAMFSLIYALGIGLSIGAAALVARRIGEKNPEGAARAAVQAIVMGILVAIPIGIAGGIYAPQLLELMGADKEVIAHGSGYTRVLFAGNAGVLLLFLINAIFRGAGDAAIAMRALWIANATNLVLDPLLIFGIGPFPELGITGAAVATTIARVAGVAYQIYRLSGRHNRFAIRRPHLRIDPAILRTIFDLSGVAIVQMALSTTSWMGLMKIVGSFGDIAVAGYTIGIRIVVFAILPAWGLANAAATMVGQALGAGKPERAQEAVWRAGRYNMAFLGSLGVVFIVAAPLIVRVFSSDPEVVDIGVDCLRIIAAGFPFYAYGMVFANSFNGAGDTWTPTWLNGICFWCWQIPLAWILAKPFGLGPDGVFFAVAIAFSTFAVLSGLLFRRGAWKSKVV